MAVVLVTARWSTWGTNRELSEPNSRHSSSSELWFCVCVCVCVKHYNNYQTVNNSQR